MKEEILQRINAVLAALNNITVCGKGNLTNLSGSIAVLEELYGTLCTCKIEGEDVSPNKK